MDNPFNPPPALIKLKEFKEDWPKIRRLLLRFIERKNSLSGNPHRELFQSYLFNDYFDSVQNIEFHNKEEAIFLCTLSRNALSTLNKIPCDSRVITYITETDKKVQFTKGQYPKYHCNIDNVKFTLQFIEPVVD